MAKLTIEIPDSLAAKLSGAPLPLPLDEYCRRALEDALLRDHEEQRWREALARQIAMELRLYLDPHVPDRLLTVSEAAELLRVSRDTLRKLIREGQLPRADVGRKQLISRRAVLSLMDGTATTVPAGGQPG